MRRATSGPCSNSAAAPIESRSRRGPTCRACCQEQSTQNDSSNRQIRNSKSETRNKSETGNSNDPKTMTHTDVCQVSDFEPWDFELVSNFELRVSDSSPL